MPASCLMVQGTASHVGKSFLVTALCRWFARAGWNVAPFKAENMSRNSTRLSRGGTIALSQAVQARAAGVSPSVDMNPVLLLPQGGHMIRIIIHGRHRGLRDSRFYVDNYTPRAREAALASLRRLDAVHELIIMEGAGSPAEVNLRPRDIANMEMARAVGARVLLVGDISRGGVFAALLGTWALLEPQERELICGLVINRYGWDKDLLEPGIRRLEAETGRPVLGVLPDLPVMLEPEDSSPGPIPAGKTATPAPDFEAMADALDEHLDMAYLVRELGWRR